MSRRDSIQSRMRRLVIIFCGFMAAVLAVLLGLVLVHNSQYKNLLYNVTTASEFNQDFKETIDLKMYYYVIESRYSEGLPIQEVQDAQALAKDLLNTTSQKDSLRAVTSVLDLCENLEDKIYQIEQTQSYDDRQMQLENNIYVLTALVQEYMYNYLYCESVQLNRLQQQVSRQIAAEMFLVAALTAALVVVLVRYSVRLGRSVTQPLVELSRRAEDVIGGDLTAREPVRWETYEIRTLSEGFEQMIAQLNAQIQEITQKQASLRKAELALLQAQINPHFLYNTMDTIIWLIEADRPQAAVEMVSNLSAFFRHSLSRGEDVITLKEEEQHVRSYLQIQQARYQDIL
ncbi:MAG: histidine kinase, partial [Oscillibacter sp.]|nr:histidine kinase [Oscillibacter sp.]